MCMCVCGACVVPLKFECQNVTTFSMCKRSQYPEVCFVGLALLGHQGQGDIKFDSNFIENGQFHNSQYIDYIQYLQPNSYCLGHVTTLTMVAFTLKYLY